jgi:hypothetical protein
MPAAIPAIITAAGQVIAGVAAYQVVATFVFNIALTALSMALSKKQRDPGPPAVNVSIRSTVEHRHLVVGTRRVGGSFVFYYTSSPSAAEPNKYLWYVVAYADHQCHALRDAWFDDRRIPGADIDPGGDVATEWTQGKVKIWSHLGTSAQTVDSQLDTAFTSWSSSDRLQGVCYRVIRMERDPVAFPSGAPQSVSSLVDGALLYDPRLDSTNGGSGSHRRDDPRTWEWGTNGAIGRNWALGVRWIISGGSVVNDTATRLVRYGLQADDSRIDDAYFAAAANISDEVLSGDNAPPSGSQPRYRLDLEASCGETRGEILDRALAAGAGELVYVHGKFRLYAGAYDAPTHSFTQDDLHGELEIDDITDEQERVNRVAATFFDGDQVFQQQTTPYRFNAAYDTQDGGRILQREIELFGVTNSYQAQRICEIELRKSRQMRRCTFRFGRKGMKVAAHETFSFSHSRYGWENRVFRCLTRKRERVPDGNGGIKLLTVITARAEHADIYADLETADYASGTSATNVIQSEAPDTPLSLTATPRALAIDFAWTLGTFWELHGIVELWEDDSGGTFATATKIWEGRGDGVRIRKIDLTTRDYWVTVRTIGGQRSGAYPSGSGVAAAAVLVDTPNIEPGAATETYADVDDYAGAAFGNNAVLQSFTITPSVDSDIEISGLAVADNILGDSGNFLAISVQPTGGSDTALSGSGTNDTSRQQHAYDANYAATGGQEITIKHKTLVGGGNPNIHVWQSSLRIAVVKR